MQHTTVGAVTLALLAIGSASAFGQVQAVAEDIKLLPPDLAADDHYGWAVATDADWLVASSPDDDTGASVYVYSRSGDDWVFEQKLLASDVGGASAFGRSLALRGDRLAVGDPNASGASTLSGAVWIFVHDGTSWSVEDELFAQDGAPQDYFGTSLALDGDRILVGASGDDDQGSRAGSAYFFRREGSSWVEEQKLLASDGKTRASFGTGTAIDGATAIVGAPDARQRGAAYVYLRSGTTWTEVDLLRSPVSTEGAAYGGGLGLEGDLLTVGEPFTVFGGSSGLTHVYRRVGGTWTHDQTLSAADAGYNDQYGWSVGVRAGRVLVAARYNDAAYVYEDQGGSFAEVARLVPAASEGGIFGNAADLSDERAVVANRLDPEGAFQGGAIFVYEMPFAPVGTSFCYGDGTAAACPCGNEMPFGASSGCRTSTGEGGMLYAGGSTSVGADDLLLRAQNVVGSVGLLFVGPLPAGGGSGLPFADGLRCVAGPLSRLGTQASAAPLWGPGLSGHSGFVAGETWYFQVYFRDEAGACVAGSNTTNGVEVTFTP